MQLLGSSPPGWWRFRPRAECSRHGACGPPQTPQAHRPSLPAPSHITNISTEIHKKTLLDEIIADTRLELSVSLREEVIFHHLEQIIELTDYRPLLHNAIQSANISAMNERWILQCVRAPRKTVGTCFTGLKHLFWRYFD